MTLAPSGEQFELRHREHHAVVVEVGGGVRSYTHAGRQVLDGYEMSERCTGGRGQLLIPWPNRVRDGRYVFDGSEYQLSLSEPEHGNAIHGLVRWSSWTCAERSPDRVLMRHTLYPQPGYPFTLQLDTEYVLGDDGLAVRTTATNAGGEPCPYGAGAHPYITVGTAAVDDVVVQAPGSSWLRADERGIPIAEEAVEGTRYDFRRARRLDDTKLDTAFTKLNRDADGRARVVIGADDREVTVWLDEGYRYLMLFTGDSLPEESRRRRSLAVEPMTCAPNAFASGAGLDVIAPGEEASASWGITPRA